MQDRGQIWGAENSSSHQKYSPVSHHVSLDQSSARVNKMLTNNENENPLFVAFASERNSRVRRSDFADLAAFVLVAERLSFRAAASRLEVTPSALSHTIRQLEERLGVRLLNRTTRSVSLTDAGQRLFERLRPAMGQIEDALEGVNAERQKPFGRLRICAIHNAAAAVIAPMWCQFLGTYPEVSLEIYVNENPVDIVANGFDAGIGPREWGGADMIAGRLWGPGKVAVVGSPEYFAKSHAPKTPDDLLRHHCIQYRHPAGGGLFEWPFVRDGVTSTIAGNGRVIVNNFDLAVRAAIDGIGVTYTIEAVAEPYLKSGQLVRVLEEWSPYFDGFFLYYSGHRQVPAALRALIDMARANGVRADGDLARIPAAF
ncbi:MAG: LysR family transcriptional regulator [Telmatospirillum sp.]|nr:LysR family transcriptional regulator [Telmatospirillum sp.]